MSEKIEVTTGSDNIFRDLGFPNPEEHLAKADLAIAITAAIEAQGLTQAEAAKRVGVTQPNISDILRGRLRPFSYERLMTILTKLGKDIKIVIKDAPRSRPQGRLTVAG